MIVDLTNKLKWSKPLERLDVNEITFIVVHHIEATNATPEDIHKWHLERGWSGAGYNEYIRKDGTTYILRGMNIGAHVQGFNHCSYGIALEGDFNKERPTQAQLDALVGRVQHLKESFPARARLIEHKGLNSTECPGKNFPFSLVAKLSSAPRIDTELESALKDLQEYLIINSADYWRNNAKANKNCNGEYVRQLIINAANTLMIIKNPPI